MPEYDVDQLLEEWRINGFVVFESLIPEETVDKIREAWVPLREAGVREEGPEPVRGTGRYNVRVQFHRPFVDPDIFEHPYLVAFLEGALGEDYADLTHAAFGAAHAGARTQRAPSVSIAARSLRQCRK